MIMVSSDPGWIIRERLFDELQGLVDAFGATPSRWPEERRRKLLTFIERDAGAAQIFALAKALDGVLAQAPGNSGMDALAKLEARIVAATNLAAQCPHEQGHARFQKERGPRRRGAWRIAALLAVSLMIGVFIGLSGKTSPMIRALSWFVSPNTDMATGIAHGLFGAGGKQERE